MNNLPLARNLALKVVLAALFVDNLYAEERAAELIGSNIDVSSGQTQQRLSPSVVYNSADNEYMVVWFDLRAVATTGNDIFGQRLSADGRLLGENIPVIQEIGSQNGPFAAYNSTDNNFLVAWQSQFDGPGSRDFNDAFGRLLSNQGVPLGSAFRISDAGLEISTAYNSRQNNYLVTGRAFASGPLPGIFGRIVSSGGFVVGEEIAISTAGAPAPAGRVVYNPNVNEYFATWQDQEERNLKGRRISSTGDLIGNSIIVSPSFLGSNPAASVAFDRANDRYLVVFSLVEKGSISGQFVSSSGALIGSNFLIRTVRSPIETPSVAHSSIHNVFFVVWPASNDVVGQLLSETGETIGSPLVIAKETASTRAETAHNTRTGDFLVVWPDDRNISAGVQDIFAQLVGIQSEAPMKVLIDVKPGGAANPVNPGSNGVIPVAILTTDRFDAANVDAATVRFGRTGTEAAPVQSAMEDVDRDGWLDMILHFRIEQTGIRCGDASASLTGMTTGGGEIRGTDSIETVGCN